MKQMLHSTQPFCLSNKNKKVFLLVVTTGHRMMCKGNFHHHHQHHHQHHHLSLNCQDHWGTTDDFTTSFKGTLDCTETCSTCL